MKHLFVSYQIALKLKELGFNESCFGHFIGRDLNFLRINGYKENIELLAPLYQQVQDWFRDNHNIQVDASSHTVNQNKKWRDYIAYVNGKPMNDARDEEYQDYYKALTRAIEEALKLIENGRN